MRGPSALRAHAQRPDRRGGVSGTQEHARRGFEALGGETVYEGRIVDVRIERFRHADGEEVSREIVRHQGAVAVVAHDEHEVWLVRQPREAVDEPALLEIPAGRLDVAGEQPLAAAQRELAEEIGRGARSWQPIVTYYTGRRLHRRARAPVPRHASSTRQHADSDENERIEIVRWPLDELDEAIDECRDAKTLIGLLWLARRLNA